jgi:N-acetylmuramoyl-L-alanine amidase
MAAGPHPIVERSFIVVLDAGHGGDNDGCRAPGGIAVEKAITLALAVELRRELRKRMPQATVILTREADQALTLSERVVHANEEGADLFLSLHANASPANNQWGFETYVLDASSSTLDAARTARRENDDGLLEPTSRERRPEIATMVRQLEMAAHRTAAARFARSIQLEQAQRFPDRPDRGVKQAPFDVLMGVRMPAVLFEAGFLDHPSEAALLLDPDGRKRIVDGLVDAVVEHYRDQAKLAATNE